MIDYTGAIVAGATMEVYRRGQVGVLASALPNATIPITQNVTIAGMKARGRSQAFTSRLTARFRLVWAMVLASAAPDADPKANSTIPFTQKIMIAGMKVYGQSHALTSKLATKLGLV
jgi:hypothetical protein